VNLAENARQSVFGRTRKAWVAFLRSRQRNVVIYGIVFALMAASTLLGCLIYRS
jgi:hypothetical protein